MDTQTEAGESLCRSDQPAKSASARVLTADEIVQQNELRKRQAGSILAKGGSFKVPRLNNNSLLEAAAKRRQRPGAIVSAQLLPKVFFLPLCILH